MPKGNTTLFMVTLPQFSLGCDLAFAMINRGDVHGKVELHGKPW